MAKLAQYQIEIQYPYRKIVPARSRIGFVHLCFTNNPESINFHSKPCCQHNQKTIVLSLSAAGLCIIQIDTT
jgi:hypothetical protein